jgi:hypothetical protein
MSSYLLWYWEEKFYACDLDCAYTDVLLPLYPDIPPDLFISI